MVKLFHTKSTSVAVMSAWRSIDITGVTVFNHEHEATLHYFRIALLELEIRIVTLLHQRVREFPKLFVHKINLRNYAGVFKANLEEEKLCQKEENQSGDQSQIEIVELLTSLSGTPPREQKEKGDSAR